MACNKLLYVTVPATEIKKYLFRGCYALNCCQVIIRCKIGIAVGNKRPTLMGDSLNSVQSQATVELYNYICRKKITSNTVGCSNKL